jgi:3-phosphoinositide dependent protein kinase-1
MDFQSEFNKNIPNGGEEINEPKDTNKLNLKLLKHESNRSVSTTDVRSGVSSGSVSPSKKPTFKDFEPLSDLGRGAYAKVSLVRNLNTNKKFAIKIMDKYFMNKLNKSHEAFIEREILSNCDHPNIIKLVSTFHDKEKLYYVLEYAPKGDLATFLRSQGILSFETGRFYAAEILNAIEYLSSKNMAHRDLKPENIVLDSNMHIKLVN